jgi:hypothetical protein
MAPFQVFPMIREIKNSARAVVSGEAGHPRRARERAA